VTVVGAAVLGILFSVAVVGHAMLRRKEPQTGKYGQRRWCQMRVVESVQRCFCEQAFGGGNDPRPRRSEKEMVK
jgi:hypothetical protein